MSARVGFGQPEREGGDRAARLVLLLGPDGSGTELCAAVLRLLGARPCRAEEVAALCDRVLALFKRDGGSPLRDYPLPPAWWADPRLEALRRDARPLLLAGPGPPVLADARLAKLLPFWRGVAAEASLKPHAVIALRAPAAAPLGHAGAGEIRALDGLVDALRFTAADPRCCIAYGEWFADPAVPLGRLLALLDPAGLPPFADLLDAAAELTARFALHPADREGAPAGQPLVRHAFGVALGSPTPDAMARRLGSFVDQFVAFRQLLLPFERAHAATLDALAAAEARAEEGGRLRGALDRAQVALGRTEAAREAADRARASLALQLQDSRAALAQADAHAARLEAALSHHAAALSDALERERAAEAAAQELPEQPAFAMSRRPAWRRVLGFG